MFCWKEKEGLFKIQSLHQRAGEGDGELVFNEDKVSV